MRKAISILIGLFLVASLGVLSAQEEKAAPKAPKVKQASLDRIAGTIKMINKDTSTITVRTSNNVDRQVVYSNDTKYTERNKAGAKFEDLKDGVRIIAVGKFDGAKLNAARIDIRQK